MGYNKFLDTILVNLWSSIRSQFGGHLVTEQPVKSESKVDPRDANHEKLDYDDDSYEAFVALMWSQPGIDLKKIHVERVWRSGEVFPAILVRLVEAKVDCTSIFTEEKTRKTYAADSRHSWQRNGAVIDSSVFQAIKLGVDQRWLWRLIPIRLPMKQRSNLLKIVWLQSGAPL